MSIRYPRFCARAVGLPGKESLFVSVAAAWTSTSRDERKPWSRAFVGASDTPSVLVGTPRMPASSVPATSETGPVVLPPGERCAHFRATTSSPSNVARASAARPGLLVRVVPGALR